MRRAIVITALAALLVVSGQFTGAHANTEVRIATFDASLNRFDAGDLVADLSTPNDAQAQTIAEIVQRVRPDILLINEFDFDAGGVAAQLFQDNYLSVSQNGANPISYPYHFVAPSNTGIPSGFDLDNDGFVGGPNDSLGFGFFPGQFAMVVYSQYPIDTTQVRTFQSFLWKDMPGALLPDDPSIPGPRDFYSPAELDVLPLSSTCHWDLPVVVNGTTLHVLASNPTVPVFDGPEDRNGRRNQDEIRFWADYISPSASGYIHDDDGLLGGLSAQDLFVVVGNMNADPDDGLSNPGAIQQLLNHPGIDSKLTPASDGGAEQSVLQGGANDAHLGDPAFDTADFEDTIFGNLRVDYVLPRKRLKVLDAGVFWPASSDPLFPLVGTFPFPSSDHRLVWVDLRIK
jgi:hypothetical protein